MLTKPNVHLFSKNGCSECLVKQIYTKQYYIAKNIPNHTAFIYIALFSSLNSSERFIKIGITKYENIRYRFRGYSEYKIDIVTSYQTDFFNAYDTEQLLLSKYKKMSYKPMIKFKGHTECLNIDCYKALIKDLNEMSFMKEIS